MSQHHRLNLIYDQKQFHIFIYSLIRFYFFKKSYKIFSFVLKNLLFISIIILHIKNFYLKNQQVDIYFINELIKNKI